VKSHRPAAVPKHMQAIYDAVVAQTDAFRRDHLGDEYRDLARGLTVKRVCHASGTRSAGAVCHYRLNSPAAAVLRIGCR
jgi:hypothetical protein